MRVISGSARGTKLETLSGNDTRPTVERVKEGLFSSLQFILAGAKVLDLYAGSGQLGIEALSRGANSCVFIDSSREACDIIKANLQTAHLFEKASVAIQEVQSYVSMCKDSFDIVLIDPPYRHDLLGDLLVALSDKLNIDGVVMCESERDAVLPEICNDLQMKKQYTYGTVMITKYVKTEVAQ